MRSVRKGPNNEASFQQALLSSLEFTWETGEESSTDLKQDIDMINKIRRNLVRWLKPKSMCKPRQFRVFPGRPPRKVLQLRGGSRSTSAF